ncbi:MAG: DNA topoisomerase I [Candidatus Aenigmarchaeota archaeon]|nr:DNA topoisomerase I [Candidatus Aenigmarchaeota archaeon]
MYSLIITEKPNAAKRVAFSLADGKPKTIKKGKTYWFEFTRKGKEYKVVPAVGHLFVLTSQKKEAKWNYPVFDTVWKPVFEASRGGKFTKAYFDNIKTLAKDAKEFYSATDFDIEGEVIFYNILKHIVGKEDAKRMKFSTLTKSDLEEAFDNASPHLTFPMLEAGLARHKMDFLWGINLSRALTLGLEHVGGYWTLSTGRVQGPTLKIMFDREREIEKFVPKPYWEIDFVGEISGKKIDAVHVEDKFWEKSKANNAFRKCEGKDGVVESVEVSQHKQFPPFPFDLTTMQRDSYSLFGYSPKMTLEIAQGLYEAALISYPRTSSQKLPAKLGLRGIIENLSKQDEYSDLCKKLLGKPGLKPNEGNKEDPAHPSIFPTGNKPGKISAYQKKLYDLIVRRFLSVFSEAAVREQIKVKIDVNGEKFKTSGNRTIVPNWIEFYGKYARFSEQSLPKMEKGDKIKNPKINMESKETTPPNRYSQASVLKVMEDLNLGTKATRAQILHTLYERDYIRENSIQVTALGSAVIKALEKNCPEIISVDLTNRFEDYMEEISNGKRNWEDVVKEAETELGKILDHFKEREKHIGNELKKGVQEFEKSITYVGKCDKCSGELRIIHSKTTGKKFVGCTNYPECNNGFPLPQRGETKATSKKCPNCGLYFVDVKQWGRRPWKLCVRCGFATKIKPKEFVDKLEAKGIDIAKVTYVHVDKKLDKRD